MVHQFTQMFRIFSFPLKYHQNEDFERPSGDYWPVEGSGNKPQNWRLALHCWWGGSKQLHEIYMLRGCIRGHAPNRGVMRCFTCVPSPKGHCDLSIENTFATVGCTKCRTPMVLSAPVQRYYEQKVELDHGIWRKIFSMLVLEL